MKAVIKGIEIEGTASELLQLVEEVTKTEKAVHARTRQKVIKENSYMRITQEDINEVYKQYYLHRNRPATIAKKLKRSRASVGNILNKIKKGTLKPSVATVKFVLQNKLLQNK